MSDATIYTDGEYLSNNPTWHAEDGGGKAADILPAILSAVAGVQSPLILEVGCGTGAVLSHLKSELERINISAKYLGLDVAADAVSIGQAKYPDLKLDVKSFLDVDERATVAIFSDVFEHLENPFEFLRHARKVSDFLVVRQPLQGDFGIFRTNSFGSAINKLGHIQFFSNRSFTAVAKHCGWEPNDLRLLAPWEMKTHKGPPPNITKKWMTAYNREYTSMLTSGFYLIGSFK